MDEHPDELVFLREENARLAAELAKFRAAWVALLETPPWGRSYARMAVLLGEPL